MITHERITIIKNRFIPLHCSPSFPLPLGTVTLVSFCTTHCKIDHIVVSGSFHCRIIPIFHGSVVYPSHCCTTVYIPLYPSLVISSNVVTPHCSNTHTAVFLTHHTEVSSTVPTHPLCTLPYPVPFLHCSTLPPPPSHTAVSFTHPTVVSFTVVSSPTPHPLCTLSVVPFLHTTQYPSHWSTPQYPSSTVVSFPHSSIIADSPLQKRRRVIL